MYYNRPYDNMSSFGLYSVVTSTYMYLVFESYCYNLHFMGEIPNSSLFTVSMRKCECKGSLCVHKHITAHPLLLQCSLLYPHTLEINFGGLDIFKTDILGNPMIVYNPSDPLLLLPILCLNIQCP